MNDVLDDQYLDWLYAKVGLQEENIHHHRLLKRLFSTEFVMLVPNDDNRCMDGIALRKEFIRSGRMIRPSSQWMNLGCSVLEMMIGVARHLAFTAEGETGEWFWHIIENLGLARYDDNRYHERRIDEITERLIWRQYSYDGNGGMFPLQEPQDDQRDVEVWFQMESYILELG